MIKHMTLYAYASAEALHERGQEAGMGVKALDMFRHAQEWELTIAVDIEDGTVKAAELSPEQYRSLREFPEDKPKWVKLWGKKGDHHFFADEATGKVAIADNSMRKRNDPTSTDDGVLWVVLKKPLQVSSTDGRTTIDLWVRDKNDEEYRCVISSAAAAFLVASFQMKAIFV